MGIREPEPAEFGYGAHDCNFCYGLSGACEWDSGDSVDWDDMGGAEGEYGMFVQYESIERGSVANSMNRIGF